MTNNNSGFSAAKMTWQLMPAIVLVLLITSNYAQAANRICGSRLAEVLAVVCRGRGYYWEIEKRTVRSARDDGKEAPREKRSVVQECCHRTCPISELESYCNHGDDMANSRPGGLLGSSLGLSRPQSGPNPSSLSAEAAAAAAAAAAASRQRFTLGLLGKPFFFVTPRRTGPLLDADKK